MNTPPLVNVKGQSAPWRVRMLVALAVGMVILAWPALFNGYPLVFDDTGTYLRAGVILAKKGWIELSWSRPVLYGLASAVCFLVSSVWPMVIAQSLVTASVLLLFLRASFPERGLAYYLFTVSALAACTSLPWLSSWLMPDVFTGLLPIVLFMLFWYRSELNWWQAIFLMLVGAFSIAIHYSHVPLAMGIIITMAVTSLFPRFRPRAVLQGLVWITGVVVFGLALIVSVNVAGGRLQLLGSAGSVFVLARFLEDGPAYEYLSSECTSRRFRLCGHLDKLRNNSNWLVWDPESPFQEIGMSVVVAEAREIVPGSLGRFPLEHARNAIRSTVTQFLSFETGTSFEPFALRDNKSVTKTIRDFYPSDWAAFRYSRQARSALLPSWLPELHQAVVVAAFAIIIGVAPFLLGRGAVAHRALLVTVAAMLIGNAFLAGAISVVDDRYQSRVIWLVPLLAWILTTHLMGRRSKRRALLPGPHRRTRRIAINKFQRRFCLSSQTYAEIAGTRLH